MTFSIKNAAAYFQFTYKGPKIVILAKIHSIISISRLNPRSKSVLIVYANSGIRPELTFIASQSAAE